MTAATATRLTTPDGAVLTMLCYGPADGASPAASIVIGGAMGVRQTFYAPFAAWLSAQGFAVTTFDYRGHGDSLTGPLRAVDADLDAWTRDYEVVVQHARAAQPDVPLYLLGHSLGAQLPGLFAKPGAIDGLLSIAAGSGYWRDNAPRLRRSVLYFWWVLVPLATRLFGYFPGRRLRKVGDLPRGVILQWRRWCLDPQYSLGAEAAAERYRGVHFPVVALSITDDELMTLGGTEKLLGFYANAPRRIERIAPADVATTRIGHFGFFRESFAQSLWPRALGSLKALAAPV